MTRAEILNCLTDRPCDSCKFHESGRCERWACVFEEKPDDEEDCEDKRMTREEAIKALKYERKTALHENKGAFDMAIKSLSAEPSIESASLWCRQHGYVMMPEAVYEQDITKAYFEGQNTPQPKMGHWIEYTKPDFTSGYKCSECGHIDDWRPNCCSKCGAKMEGGADD